MSIDIIPQMTPEELESILTPLPEPFHAEVALYGSFDYSSIYSQAQEAVPSIRLSDPGGLIFRLEKVSKESILNIYKRSKEVEKRESTFKKIELRAVKWYLQDDVQIKLTPWEISVKYAGREPTYISKMRKEVAKTKVKLDIKINLW
ncbi:MAG TPA: hypothetical protein VJI75_03560 [Candidatus Nanoarchaeia archaeon]|nr:hypothetical protein [Candidatus Nanoarchaeia archaeon]